MQDPPCTYAFIPWSAAFDRRDPAPGNQIGSARGLVLSGRVLAHGIDIDGVEQPVQLLAGELDDRLQLPGPDESEKWVGVGYWQLVL